MYNIVKYIKYTNCGIQLNNFNISNHMSYFPQGSVVKNPPTMQETQETQFRSLGWADPLEKEMITHASILAWEIPWTEESGRIQSMESQKSQT